MNTSRTRTAILNTTVSTLVYMIQLVMMMLVRVFFIRYLGKEYLGLTGVYTSLISMLSITDLGLDAVFLYLLYKPLANNQWSDVRSLLLAFRKIYRVVVSVVFIAGLVLLGLLPYILGKQAMELSGVYIIFMLYVLNTMLSYGNATNRSLIIANQRVYEVSLANMIMMVIVSLLQIIMLINFRDPVIYMVIQVLGTAIFNFFISYRARRLYPEAYFLKKGHVKNSLSPEVKSDLLKNAVGGFSNRLGGVVVFGSDNILLSMFVGLSSVALYSNYTALTTAVTRIASQVSNSLVPSIGNLGVSEGNEKKQKVFFEITFVNHVFAGVVSLGFYSVANSFITLWVGRHYVLPSVTTLVIVLSLWFTLVRKPSIMFIDAFGLQWIQKWKPVVESVVNLLASLFLVLVLHLGLLGVLLGTIFSTVTTVLWYEPYVVIRNVFQVFNVRAFIMMNLKFAFIQSIALLFAKLIVDFLNFQPLLGMVTYPIMTELFYFVLVGIMFWKSDVLENLLIRFNILKRLKKEIK